MSDQLIKEMSSMFTEQTRVMLDRVSGELRRLGENLTTKIETLSGQVQEINIAQPQLNLRVTSLEDATKELRAELKEEREKREKAEREKDDILKVSDEKNAARDKEMAAELAVLKAARNTALSLTGAGGTLSGGGLIYWLLQTFGGQ